MWLQNLGFTQTDATFGAVIVGLVILTAMGGDFGEIGWWGLVLLAFVAVMAKWGGYLQPIPAQSNTAMVNTPSSTGFSITTGAAPGVT